MRAQDQYSLTELCFKLALSPAWVKKIEGHLAFKGNASGQRGKRSYYSSGEFDFFQKVKILRLLGFLLDDVKALFEKEFVIQNYLYKHFNPVNPDDSFDKLRDLSNDAPPDYPFAVYLTSSIFGKRLYKHHILHTYQAYQKDKRVEAERLGKMYLEFKDIIMRAYSAAKTNHDLLGQEIDALGRLIGPVGG